MGASNCNPRARARFVYQPVDWFRVIVELKKTGWCMQTIGGVVGVRSTTVNSWVNNGVEPRHRHGERLLMLYTVECGRSIPRII